MFIDSRGPHLRADSPKVAAKAMQGSDSSAAKHLQRLSATSSSPRLPKSSQHGGGKRGPGGWGGQEGWLSQHHSRKRHCGVSATYVTAAPARFQRNWGGLQHVFPAADCRLLFPELPAADVQNKSIPRKSVGWYQALPCHGYTDGSTWVL